MKLNIHNTLVAFAFNLVASAAFSAVYAQDAQFPTIEHFAIDSAFLEKEKISLTGEPEPKVTIAKIPKDSATVVNKNSPRVTPKVTDSAKTSAKHETEVKGEENGDDSVLSFNFLYYIFQKYKLQDIVD